MKNSVFALLLTLIIAGCSAHRHRSTPIGFVTQKNIASLPFQVIASENARRLGSVDDLNFSEYLSLDDLVKLESGHLILAHFSGHFLEFEMDTLISIWELAQSINDRLNINPDEAKYRVKIDRIKLDYPNRGQYFYPILRHPTHLITNVCPIENSHEISLNNPKVCFTWKHQLNHEPERYEIQLKNIFDEPLDTLYTTESALNLDFSTYDNPERLFIAKVFEVGKPENQSSEIGIILGSQFFYVPSTIPDSSIEAIEMGYYLESNGYYHDASTYYHLAAELSNRVIYDQLLELYKKRE